MGQLIVRRSCGCLSPAIAQAAAKTVLDNSTNLEVALLARRSLPLVVTISDPDVHAAVRQYPHHSLAAYQRTVAGQLLDERQIALDHMRRQGVLTLDVPADQLSLAVINRYLELKGRVLL